VSRVVLVSCVAAKQSSPTRASDLYRSTWFIKARKLVRSSGEPWFILSAEHGLLSPDALVAPYERTLNTMRASERRQWAQRVQLQMSHDLPVVQEVVVMAGHRYVENLMPYLQARFSKVSLPLKGLGIGKQLSWLDHAASL
jgi:hypothetical protein